MYGAGIGIILTLSLLVWVLIAGYSGYEYFKAWINDTKVEKPWLFKVLGMKWNRYNNGGDLGIVVSLILSLILFLLVIGSLIWVIFIPIVVLVALAFYLRYEKRKEKS